MTVAEASSVSPLYVGNNVTTEFDFDFRVLSDDEITVYQLDTTTDTESVLVKDVDYSVALTNEGLDGGSITMIAGAPATTIKLRIARTTDKDQLVNIANQGAFYPSVLNGAFDKAILLIQEISEALDRSVLVSPVSAQTPSEVVAALIEDAALAISTANAAVATANASLAASIAYTNNAVASALQFSGAALATWSTSVSDGDDSITTPYSFTHGILMVGGSMYNLSDPTQVTLDNTGAATIINFSSAFIADHEVILIVF